MKASTAIGRGLQFVRPAVHSVTGGLQKIAKLYGMRVKRRRLLVRAILARKAVDLVVDRTDTFDDNAILAFVTVRNEMERLPFFLNHYRALGVDHFLFVVNDSDDGTLEFLNAQPDASVWATTASYKQSRFGLDWINGLLMRYGNGHWCLTLDADELLVYPHHETRPLQALTEWMDDQNLRALPAMMLDMYPKGQVGQAVSEPGQNPIDILSWFDHGNYCLQVQEPMQNLWIQGGPRARMFFADDPRRAPTLNKIPLVRWNWRYAYVNSTHSALPPKLNQVYRRDGGERVSGILLHTKFLDTIVQKSVEEQARKQHFNKSELYDDYYAALSENPVLWNEHSTKYLGWKQLEELGLLSSGGWA